MNCNNTISATLDLAQAVEIFQQTMTKELLVDEVSKWDGRTVRDREQKIRQAALILAGQCIALLLHNLSQSKEAQTTATIQTQGWRHPKSKGNGRVERQVLCLGNVVVCLRLPYVVERSKQQHSRHRKIRGQGFCPFLRWLCMEEGITPLVWSTVAEAGTVSGSFAIARSSLKDWGISISQRRVERLTYNFNQQRLSQRHSLLFDLKQGALPTTPILKGQGVVIVVDGGRTRIRAPKKGKRRQNSNRHGYKGEWIEPKLLTIYVVEPLGKRVNTTEIPVTNDGTYGKLQPFLELLEMHLVRLAIHLASQVVLIADGAEWIWKHIPPLLQRARLVRPLQHTGYSTFTTQQNIYILLQKQLLLNCPNNKLGLSKPVLHSNAENQLIYLLKCRL
jgi:hypothetical protein